MAVAPAEKRKGGYADFKVKINNEFKSESKVGCSAEIRLFAL